MEIVSESIPLLPDVDTPPPLFAAGARQSPAQAPSPPFGLLLNRSCTLSLTGLLAEGLR